MATKCDFCEHSDNKDGKMVCRRLICFLSQKQIDEILDKMAAASVVKGG